MTKRVLGAKVAGAWCCAGCLVLGAVLGAGVLGAQASAQERIANAKVESLSAAQGLARAVRSVADRNTAAWVAYQVPMLPDNGRRFCDARPALAFLEPPPNFTVLVRSDAGTPIRLRTFTPECDIDAGGMPVAWITDVKPDESARWIAALVTSQPDATARDPLVTPAITAIALHATPAAAQELISLARTTKSTEVRKEAMTWLSRSKDPQALKFLADLLTPK